MKRFALAAPLLAAVLAGCVPDRPWPDAPRDPLAAEQAGLDSLRLAGRWDEANVRAAERAARWSRLAGVPAWRRADAVREAATLRTIAALPDSGRAELAAAERALRDGERLTGRDSLSAAEAALERAFATRRRWLGEAHEETQRAALSLARAALWAGHADRCLPLARSAAASLATIAGPEHPLAARATLTYAWTLRSFGSARDRASAVGVYDRACRALTRALGPVSADVAFAYTGLANHYRTDPLATRRDAEQLFRHAIAVRRAAPDANPEDVASGLSALGILLVQDERWAEAERLLGEALAIRRADPAIARPAGFSLTLTTHGQALQRLGRNREAIVELREAAAQRETLWARTDRDEGGAMMMNFVPYRELAIALAADGRAEPAFEAFERGNSRRMAERQLGEGLAADDPWRGLLARVQRVLPPDAALLFWIRTPARMRHGDSPIWACVVRSSGPPRWRALPLAPDAGGLFSRDRMGVTLRAAWGWPVRVTDTLQVRRAARRMGREWFDPFEGDLAGVRELVVTQPDLVSGVPLESLVGADGRWLGERFRVSYAPSALLWVTARERTRAAAPLASRPALLVGDTAIDPDATHLPPLAAAREEIGAIAARFPRATVLAGEDATATRLRALAASGELARFGLIHVAAHSDVEPRLPMQSALVLPATRGGSPEASHVRAAEIATRWRLDADLVSLASCWSQAGASSATDGPFGLEQAFFAAGARSLLVSLWPVDDAATALFMRRFYENLTRPGAPVARDEALREARTWLRAWRAADGTHPYAHPCYWAAFVLIGDAG